jgi:Tfp pilus assembly protein PilN
MIEINLLPGSGKKSRGRGAGINIGAAFSGALAKVKDPFLLAAAASVVLVAVAIGGLFSYQTARASSLVDREQKAVQDSTRYAAVLREKRLAEAQRDSVIRQLGIIKSIDNNRFVWPHVMDEVSRALPPYTWLTSINQTSAVQSMAALDAPPADTGKKGHKEPAVVVEAPMTFRIIGNTVDIQALTRFMRDLEASPFIKNVNLAKSNLVAADGKEVTQFQLDAEYSPDSASIRTVPVSLSVR